MSKQNELIIEKMIYVIRDHKVMLDSDLAELYEVDTKVLNQAVKRNISRFPLDFMFQLTSEECDSLRSQFVTSKVGRGGRRYLPYVFTENGVAMLSSVLSSEKAIQINVSIMRIFTRLRSFLLLEKDLSERVTKLEHGTNQMFKVVFERLDSYEEMVTPKLPGNRKKVGLK
ncbi:MAG: ORF6N domain-containing protein [Bacteriovoracaceae bacterium]